MVYAMEGGGFYNPKKDLEDQIKMLKKMERRKKLGEISDPDLYKALKDNIVRLEKIATKLK